MLAGCRCIPTPSPPTPQPAPPPSGRLRPLREARTPRLLPPIPSLHSLPSLLNYTFLVEAVRGVANALQGLSSILFTGTSVLGLLSFLGGGGGQPQPGSSAGLPGLPAGLSDLPGLPGLPDGLHGGLQQGLQQLQGLSLPAGKSGGQAEVGK